MSAKEEYEKVQYEKAEAQFLTRVEPLGKDRHGRVYWMFPGSEDKLFVQVPDEEQTAVLDQRAKVFEDCPAIQEMFNEMPAVKLLYQCRYSRRVFKWGFYDSAITLWHLCDNFDSSNAEERELVKLIKARYTIQEPASPFLTEGSEYIGRHVKRVFNKKVAIILFTMLIDCFRRANKYDLHDSTQAGSRGQDSGLVAAGWRRPAAVARAGTRLEQTATSQLVIFMHMLLKYYQ